MRLFKHGVSAVVVMGFVMFLSGLSFAAPATDISGTVVGQTLTGRLAVGVAKVSVEGTTTDTYTREGGPGSGGFYALTIPGEPEAFVLKVAKAGYASSYTFPQEGNSITDFKIFLLSEEILQAFYTSTTGIDHSSAGTSTLMVITYDGTGDGTALVYDATACVRDSAGVLIADTGSNIRYIKTVVVGTDRVMTLSTIPDDETFGYIVFNLPVGSYTVSATKGLFTFGFRPAFVLADGVTVGSNATNGVLLAAETIDPTVGLVDETGTPVAGANLLLIGGADNFSGTTAAVTGTVDYTDIPYVSGGWFKATKSGYVPTYSFTGIDVGAPMTLDEAGNTYVIVSTAALNQILTETGAETELGKGHISGFIQDYYGNPVKNATLEFYDAAGVLLTTQPYVFFTASTPGTAIIDPALTATSDSGGFVVFNQTPEELIYLRVGVPYTGITTGRGDYLSSLFLTSTFANGITARDLQLNDLDKANLHLSASSPVDGTAYNDEEGVVMLQFALTETENDENVDFNSVTIIGSGTGNEATDVAAVHLYQDVDNDGMLTGADGAALASGTFDADNGTVTLANDPLLTIDQDTTDTFLVVYDFGAPDLAEGLAVYGKTFRVSIAGNSDIDATGTISHYGISVNGAPVAGGEKMIVAEGAHLTVSPTAWDFGTKYIDDSSTKNIVIMNDGADDVTVDTVIITGPDGADFDIDFSAVFPFLLHSRQWLTIPATFNPQSEGAKTITLTINSNVAPIDVVLEGTGAIAPADEKHISVTPPDPLGFGSVTVAASSAAKTITIRNTSSVLSITGTVGLSNITDFDVTGSTPFTLAPSATRDVVVIFNPATVGAKTLNVTVTSDALETPITVTLTGTGTAAAADEGSSGATPVGPLAAGISALLVWWKSRKQRQE